MDPIVNKIKDGIHMDNTPQEQPEDTYRYARNFVIHQVANGMYKAVTLKGTELYFTVPDNEKPMAFTSIRNRYFLIILNDTDDIVKFYELIDSIDHVATLNLLKQISNTYMNLSFDWPIRTIFGFYENDQVQRMYFTDYHNSPRVVNVIGMTVHSDSKFAKYLSFTPILENIYGQFIFDSINAGGNLLSGNYFIAWQYYTEDGYYSDWSPLSLPVSVTPSNPGSTLDDYQNYEGGDPSINSAKSIKFRIKNIDTDYSSIRIAAFYSNDYNSSGPGIIFYDGDVSASEMTFFLRGSENLGTLTLDELIEHTMSVEKCKSIAPIKLYNVAACIKERDELDFMPLHANNLLPVQITTKINELLADTTGYPTVPFAAGSKSLFAVPKCAGIITTLGPEEGYAGIWYKAIAVSEITSSTAESITKQIGEYYRDMAGKFTLVSGAMVPIHIINKYDMEGVALKGTVLTTQTAQTAVAREDTIFIDGTWGFGTITIGGLTRAITFSNDIHETVQNFVTNWYNDYISILAPKAIKLSSYSYSSDIHVLVATAVTAGEDFVGDTVLTPTVGDLSGNIVNTTPFIGKIARKDTITLTGAGGNARIICNGITIDFSYIDSLVATALKFIELHYYTFYASGVIVSTNAVDPVLIFEARVPGTDFTGNTTINNVPSGDLSATITNSFIAGNPGQQQVNKVDLAGSTNGSINITCGTITRTLTITGALDDAILQFVTDNYNTFITESGVEMQAEEDYIFFTSVIAGIQIPEMRVDRIDGDADGIITLFMANIEKTMRVDKVVFTGTNGSCQIVCNGYSAEAFFRDTLQVTGNDFYYRNNNDFYDNYVIVSLDELDEKIVYLTANTDDGSFSGPTVVTKVDGTLSGSVDPTTANFVGNKRKVTITLTGTDGAANISVNGLTKKITYATSKTDTALAFKNANAVEFLTKNITLTNNLDDLILESTVDGLDFTTAVTIVHTNVDILTGVVYNTVPNVTPRIRIDTITLTGTKGTADIKVSGLIKPITFLTSLEATAAQFVTDNAAAYDSISDITVTSVGDTIIFTGKVAGVNFNGPSSIINKNHESNVEELPYIGEYMDYKGPTAASRLRGYPSDEYIRLGVLFFDLNGKPFFVRWLDNTVAEGGHGDVFIPRRDHTSGNENSLLSYYDTIVDDVLGIEFNQINSRNVFLNISGLDITTVKDQISGFMIVRAPIVHRNLAYGNLSFISYTLDDLFLNPGYHNYAADASKYSGVYSFVCPEDLFDFKDFVVTKGDKLKNIFYMAQQRKAYTIGHVDFTGFGKKETDTGGPSGTYPYENLYSKFYLPATDAFAPANGKEQIKHDILYSLKYNVGDGAVGDPAGVIVDPRNVNKLFQDRTRDIVTDYRSSPGKTNIIVLDIDETGNNVKGIFNVAADDARMLICSVYRENNDPYGGYGDASLANTLYMSTGHYQEINSVVLEDVKKNIDGEDKYIFNNIEIYGGDTFVCLFDHKRNIINEDDGADFRRYGYSVIFPVESRMNLTLREGNHVAKNHSYSATDPLGLRRSVGSMKLEDYNYNDGYSSDNLNALYHSLPFGFVNNSKFEARMRYTQPKVPGEKIDKFRIFPPLNKIDLSINYGIINNIRENYGYLLYWQEDQIGSIPINERQLASNAFGSAVQLGVGGVFERYDEIITLLGNSHQFGLIDSPIGYHWYDAKRRIYLSLYKDMKLSQDSIVSGLNTFFDGLPDIYDPLESLRLDRPGRDYGICGVFDPKNKIVLSTFFMEGRDPETVGISTLNNKFVGFFDYKSRFYFNMKNETYSFKDISGELHKHNTGQPLTIHGELKEGSIQFVIKDQSNLDKLYDTFNIIGNDNFFDKIRYQNSDQDIEEDLSLLSVEQYRYRNKRWFGSVPLIERLRIMDNHMLVTFKVTVSKEVELYQITFNTRRMI